MDNNTLWRAMGHQHDGNEVLCTVVKIPAPVRCTVDTSKIQCDYHLGTRGER